MKAPLEFRRRLWVRLLVTYLLPFAMIVGSLVWLTYNAARQTMERQLGESLTALAKTAVLQVGKPRALRLRPGDEKSRTYRNLQEKLKQLRQATGVEAIYLVDMQGQTLVDDAGTWSVGERIVKLAADEAELNQVRQGQAMASMLFADQEGRWIKTGFAPVRLDGRVQALVGVDGSASFFGPLSQLGRILALLGALALALVAAVTWWGSKRITRPLDALAQAARQIGHGHFDAEIQTTTADEIGVLAHTLNEMRTNILKRDQHLQMMLSGIAHEVRNPLGGMTLFVGLLKEELHDRPEALKHVRRIGTEMEYLDRVVNDFLDFARKKPPVMESVEPAEEFEQLTTLLASELEEKNIELKQDVAATLGSVFWDRERMRRALLNLLRNAIQATDPGGTVHLGIHPDGSNTIEIQVRDNGKGIPEENKERIFEPFYTTKQKGTGLGLALVKKTVESHGGLIRVDCETGTRFSIRLPRSNSANTQEA